MLILLLITNKEKSIYIGSKLYKGYLNNILTCDNTPGVNTRLNIGVNSE